MATILDGMKQAAVLCSINMEAAGVKDYDSDEAREIRIKVFVLIFGLPPDQETGKAIIDFCHGYWFAMQSIK